MCDLHWLKKTGESIHLNSSIVLDLTHDAKPIADGSLPANARLLFRVQEFLGAMAGQLAFRVGTETILEVLGQTV